MGKYRKTAVFLGGYGRIGEVLHGQLCVQIGEVRHGQLRLDWGLKGNR